MAEASAVVSGPPERTVVLRARGHDRVKIILEPCPEAEEQGPTCVCA